DSGGLVVAGVSVAEAGAGRVRPLAAEPDDEPQRAVRGRVLRPEVEDHVARVELDVHLRVGQVAPRLPVDGEVGAHELSPSSASAACAASAPPPLSASAVALPFWAAGVSSPGMGSTSTRPGHGFTTRASNG